MEICDCIAIFYAISQRVQCNVDDIKSLLGLFEFIVMNKEFVHSQRLRACSYLLLLSLYQALDPSDHAPYVNPRNNSQIGRNTILNSGHELRTALNTMTNNLSTINKVHNTEIFCLILIINH